MKYSEACRLKKRKRKMTLATERCRIIRTEKHNAVWLSSDSSSFPEEITGMPGVERGALPLDM